jgi:hypothetical protein
VWHRIIKTFDLDVIVDPNADEPPFGIFPFRLRQGLKRWPVEALEQIPAADREPAHGAGVHAVKRFPDRPIAFSQGEEGQVAHSAENVTLGKADSGFNGRLIPRAIRPGRENANPVMGRHLRVATVDFGIVKRGLIHSTFQVVWDDEPRQSAEKAEHAHMPRSSQAIVA